MPVLSTMRGRWLCVKLLLAPSEMDAVVNVWWHCMQRSLGTLRDEVDVLALQGLFAELLECTTSGGSSSSEELLS